MTEARAPRPSVISGFVPTFERALRGALRGKKVLGLLFVLALPPLLHLLIPDRVHPDRLFEVVSMVVLFLYLQGLVPLTGLAFGTSILLDETGGGTLPYLFTRPVPRSSILLAKLAGQLPDVNTHATGVFGSQITHRTAMHAEHSNSKLTGWCQNYILFTLT